MVSTNSGFFKNEECPSSNDLLLFENGEMPKARSGEVRRHLLSCEFCEAEVEFYATYPQAAEESSSETAEIPAPLFELAEALLRNRHTDGKSLNVLLKEKLVQDKA